VRVVKVLRLAVALLYVFVLVVPRGVFAQEKPAEPQWDYAMKERVPMALIVLTPTGKIGEYSSNAIVGAAAPVLEEHTNLKLDDLSRIGKDVTHCKGRLVCFVETVRSDYEPSKADFRQEDNPNQLKPWSEVRRMLAKDKPARFLAVLSAVRQADGTDRLSGVLIDTDAALDFIHRATDRKERSDPKKEEELEDKVAQYAVRASPAPETVSKAEEIDRALYKMFAEDFRAAFEAERHWMPYGSIVIECEQAGFEIVIDNDSSPIGRTRAGKTTIGRVMPGDHRVKLTKPEFIAAEANATVERGAAALVTLSPVPEPREGVRLTRKIVFWTGIVSALAGAAILALSFQQQASSDHFVLCLSSQSQAECGGRGEFLKFPPPSNDMLGFDQSITEGRRSDRSARLQLDGRRRGLDVDDTFHQ
jgi:hypothetical protein